MRKPLIGSGIVVLLVILTFVFLGSRIHTLIRDRTEKVLQIHFASQITFSDFQVSIFPHVHVTISNLLMRHKGRTDIPPLIQIRTVSMYGNLLSLMRPEPHIAFVQLDGLQIHTPPRQPGGTPLIHGTDQDLARKYPVLIEEIRAEEGVIIILRAQPDKPPREFPIHHLQLHDVSFDRPAQFHALLTNPVPPGEIDAAGEFGPWLAETPSQTPAAGQYIFQNADLGTLKGIRGILSSKGRFNGPLDYLKVDGSTDIPDFGLRTAAHSMALHTDFSAIVDGTNGDIYLTSVAARFLHTTLAVSGKIVDADRELKGRTILLDAVSDHARVEDLISIAVKTNDPVMTGNAKLKVKIDIPEGDPDLIERLKLRGQFGIGDIQFATPEMQGKIDTLSRKSQGQPKDMGIQGVPSEMTGNMQVSGGIVTFSNLSFGVPGAALNLSGTYNLDTEGLNFHGKLTMDAKLSQTTTGAKSFFLKALDPFFKGKNAGTVLPIKISGTKDKPTFGLDRGSAAKKDEPAQRSAAGSANPL
jgi:hypothetical protein